MTRWLHPRFDVLRRCATSCMIRVMAPNEEEYRTPGQLISALLKDRDWTQRTLAVVLGIGVPTVSKIVSGVQPVTAEMALALAELFGVEAERFLALQTSYELARARLVARPDPGRVKRAHLFGGLPIAEMLRRGWIEAEDRRDPAAIEAELAQFFGTDRAEDIEFLPHAAKKTEVTTETTPVQLAWLYRVRQIAREMLVARYSPGAAREAIDRLDRLLSAPEEARKVPRILTECGIRFVIVQTLKSAKIDGACFWLNESSPVIGMTMRYDRIDNFWFVLRHELEHVLRRHGQAAVVLDAELEGDRAGTGPTVTEEERVANQAAADFCVPQQKMEMFIARKDPYFAERDVLAFSRMLGVHPGLIAGQIQRHTGRYNIFRKHLVKIRSLVAPSAVVDGWGDVVPVDV